MDKRRSKKKIFLITLATVFALIVASFGTIFIIRKIKNHIDYDYEKGKIAYETVENAQYIPDVELLVGNKARSGVSLASYTPVSTNNIDELELRKLMDSLATIENESGAGKYLGYDIYEIKDEIAFVVKNVPAFDQWIRMPNMREEQGYANIPYYEDWAYYLEMDDDVLVITRFSWTTRTRYLDFENKKTIEDYSENESIVQYDVVQMKYYTNEENDEVVEFFEYCVGVDHVKNGKANSNEEDYKPYEYLYLKNVKDKSLTKYHVVAAERYRDSDSFDQGGMDISGDTPYGTTRDFLYLDYTDASNMQILSISEVLPTKIYKMPQTTVIQFYNEINNNVEYYMSMHDYDSSNNENNFDRYGNVDFLFSLDDYSRYPNYMGSNVEYSQYPNNIKKYYTLSTSESNLVDNLTSAVISLSKEIGLKDVDFGTIKDNFTSYHSLSTTNNMYEYYFDEMITKMCEYIVNNSYLKNNFKTLYLGQYDAKEAPTIRGPFNYTNESDYMFTDFRDLMDFYYSSDLDYSYSVTVNVENESLLDLSGKYGAALIFKNVSNDDYYILDDINYDNLERVNYNGSTTEFYYRLSSSSESVHGSLQDTKIDKEGDYILSVAIFQLVDGKNVMIFDSKQNVYITRFANSRIVTYDFEKDGESYVSEYTFDGTGRTLKVHVDVKEK
jgi:hypothetical protein